MLTSLAHAYLSIRRHGSDVYVGMVVVVYTVIQWKSSASVLQGCKLATGTVEEEVRTVH